MAGTVHAQPSNYVTLSFNLKTQLTLRNLNQFRNLNCSENLTGNSQEMNCLRFLNVRCIVFRSGVSTHSEETLKFIPAILWTQVGWIEWLSSAILEKYNIEKGLTFILLKLTCNFDVLTLKTLAISHTYMFLIKKNPEARNNDLFDICTDTCTTLRKNYDANCVNYSIVR